jgi:hypothetical protein
VTRQTRLLPSGRQLRLAGFGYLGIIAVAIVAGAAMVAGPHRLARAAASGLAAAAMAGYVLPRALPAGHRGAQRTRPGRQSPASGEPETTTSRISR